jgi:TonB family protein
VARTINIYGFQALHAAIKKGMKTADSEITRQAIHEFEGWPLPSATPVLQRRVVPAPAQKSVRTSLDDDDFFDTGKDQGLQALLEHIRTDRAREQSHPVAAELANVPAMPGPPLIAATTRPEPIPFSIAAVLKTTESVLSVTRAAAATAPALEKQEEATVVAERVTPVAKAPMLVVPSPKAAPAEPVAMPVPAKPNKTTMIAAAGPQMWRDRRVQIGAAIAGLALLAGAGGAFAYKSGWFNTTQTASAAPANQPVAAVPTATNPGGANSAAGEVTPSQANREEPKPDPSRRAAASTSAATPLPRVAEIAPGQGKRLAVRENEPAPIAPISLGTSAQPNFGAALTPSSSGVTLESSRVSDVKPAVAIAQPKPAYPDMANRLGITGMVVLKVQVNAQGKPTKVAVISGHPVLAAAAQSAVMSGWRFSPATLGGNPVESESEIRINFKGSR